jgi:DNA-binding transcriptional ArsR family regulator
LDDRQTSELETLFKVLGNGTRLRLVHALVKAGELCVSDLAQQIGVQTQAVSNQLKQLALQGVVVPRRHGNHIYYSVIDNCVITMVERGLCLIACAVDRGETEG